MSEEFLLSVLVNNQFGVLTRIAGMFARRGYNIKSLSVGETEDERVSRMTIVAHGDTRTKIQMLHQLSKQVYVRRAAALPMDSLILRELLLLKVRVPNKDAPTVISATQIYGAKVSYITGDVMIIELSDEAGIIESFIDRMKNLEVIELCRTGVTALDRGEDGISDAKYDEEQGDE